MGGPGSGRHASKRLEQSLPRLSIHELRRVEFFGDEVAGIHVKWDWHPWAVIEILKRDSDIHVVAPVAHTVTLGQATTPPGALRPKYELFVCECGARRTALYLDPETLRLRCRGPSCLNLTYESCTARRSPLREAVVRHRNLKRPRCRPKNGHAAFAAKVELARLVREEAVGRWANHMVRRAWCLDDDRVTTF